MIYLAVVLSGLGGLLAELVLVRRFGLLLGNTSEASAFVIGSYLLGLGVGGLLVPLLGRRVARPLAAAGAVYLCVAVTVLGFDLLLRGLEPVSASLGFGLLLLSPGIPTVLMGLAFPLVFAGLPPGWQRWQVGALMAANLAGSLVGTALGGNWWIPELGLVTSAWLAAGAYVAASLLLLAAGAWPPERAGPAAFAPRRLPEHLDLALAAALSGALVVGLQILLLRRLPFYLEGFQPTLSGVLASCLLALSLGSALGTGLLGRLFGERAPALSLALAVLCLNVGLQEHAVRPLSRLAVTSDLGLHARIWLCALVSAGPTCFFLGAVVPLCVSRFQDPALRSVMAGRLFFWQGVGSILGSLTVGHLVPALWPRAFFVVTPVLLGGVCLVLLVRWLRPPLVAGGLALVAIASLTGLSGPGRLLAPEPPLQGPARDRGMPLRLLDHRSDSVLTASVSYDRSRHSMVLHTNEFRATETGPFADYMKVLGHLPFLLRDDLEEVAVIAFGTGTTAKSVVTWPEPRKIHLVEISEAVLHMAPHFSGVGPLRDLQVPRFLQDLRTRIHITDGRRFLGLLENDRLDLITIEPLLPYAPGTASLYTREFYALAARALRPRGLMVQWVPTHALPEPYYATLLATFGRSFAHSSVWFVDGATLLVGSEQPHLPDLATLEERLDNAPEQARIALHEAGLASAVDLAICFLGSDLASLVGAAPDLVDDRPFVERVGIWKYDGTHRWFYRPNYRVLAALTRLESDSPLDREGFRRVREERVAAATLLKEASLAQNPLANSRQAARLLERARERLPESVLLYVEETLALRFARAHQMAWVGQDRAGEIARKHLRRDAGSAIFQAARALPAPDGEPALAPDRAAALAVAIDPLFFQDPPVYLAHLTAPANAESPLESLGYLQKGAALAEAAVRDDPLGAALRAAYRVRSGLALIEVLAERPLTPAEQRALSVLLDPALLSLAEQAVMRRGGVPAQELGRVTGDLARSAREDDAG